ncbi:nuclear cap-binding protein subunit 2 [Acrasis kona]|uniref:Nuclear cap-binding protein subunit 2 n=1 Tax=Acrasis kona TaxID=1008807 RepID=A0AAW2YV41_9EUKA
MAHLYDERSAQSNSAYFDIKLRGNDQKSALKTSLETSTTLYVGNLPTTVKEEQLHALFSSVGAIERIVLGVDRDTKEPCGFCFVEYITRQDAEDCIKYIHGTQMKHDTKPIYIDWDLGYTEGREFRVKKGPRRSGGGYQKTNIQYNLEFDENQKKYKVEVKESERRNNYRGNERYGNRRDRDRDAYHNSPRSNLGKRRRSRTPLDEIDYGRGRSRSRSPVVESDRKRPKVDEEVTKE